MLRSIRAVRPCVPISRGKHTLPDLPYDYNALEPYISAEIMQLHHSKHHQAYVTNFNISQSKLVDAIEKNDLKAQVEVESALHFNRGGHINHRYILNA